MHQKIARMQSAENSAKSGGTGNSFERMDR
jgi:hypothetical protein